MQVDINKFKKSKLYSEELGIDLRKNNGELFRDSENTKIPFMSPYYRIGGIKYEDKRYNGNSKSLKWFLASILFGTRISETIAKNTYKTFEKYELLKPGKILKAGWDFLVNPIMREGGYVRYDGKTSTQILRNCQTLLKKYKGSLKVLHEEAKNSDDLENKLLDFYGVGPITANIFLRELRPFWEKSNPEPLPVVKKIAERCEVDLNKYNRKSLTFVRIEAGLIRLRKEIKKH